MNERMTIRINRKNLTSQLTYLHSNALGIISDGRRYNQLPRASKALRGCPTISRERDAIGATGIRVSFDLRQSFFHNTSNDGLCYPLFNNSNTHSHNAPLKPPSCSTRCSPRLRCRRCEGWRRTV